MIEIGIAGTFDVENYGDLLFPLVAEAELARRLGPVRLRPFSYTARQPPAWPYPVTSVADLPAALEGLDGMLIGGGHIIRFDKAVAEDYWPPNADIHHPSGYWLMPALLAVQHGCPVAWNCPGAHGAVPEWAEPLVRIAIAHSDYVAVRDEPSRAALVPCANSARIEVVPDTCFTISRLVDRHAPSAKLTQLRESAGLSEPYVVVQASEPLRGFCRFLQRHRERFAPWQFLALPIGPALGDQDSVLTQEFDGLKTLPGWPDPLLMAELIAGAAATVGMSLHLAITALSCGIPAFRPRSLFDGKFAFLSEHQQVHAIADDGEIDPDWFESRLVQSGADARVGQVFDALDRHWDRVAECFSSHRRNRGRRDILDPLMRRLPQLLELEAEQGGELDRLRTLLDAQYSTVSQRDRHIASINPAREQGHRMHEEPMTERDAGQNGRGAPDRRAADPAVAVRLQEVISERDATISARDARIAELSAIIAQRDEQLGQLQAFLGAREQRIALLETSGQASALEAARLARTLEQRERQVEQLNRMVQTRNEQVRAFRESTSWKITAPVRRVRSLGKSADAAPIVRFDRLEQQPLTREPYDWAFANGLFAADDAQALVATYPRDHFKTVKGYDGEKGYEYEARALIHLGAHAISFSEQLSGAWSRLANDLLSPDYRAAVTRLTGLDLMSAPMEAYVCHFGPGAWLGPHLDLKDKIMTHVFYFNDSWDPNNGGCLNILRSSDMADTIAEIPPIVGNSSVLVRASNSWHAVTRVVNGVRTSRRSMNVIFYHPGAVSTMWPPGDATPLHDYAPPEG